MYHTRSQIIHEINTRKENNIPLYAHYIKKNTPKLITSSVKEFGGWKEAVMAAGIEYDHVRKYKNWTKESIIEEIHTLRNQGIDLSFRSMMLSKHASLVYAAIRPRRFGSWRKALLSAGLPATDIYRYRSWNNEDIISEIKRLAVLSTDMSSKKMDESYNALISTARRRFGSWASALARAGVEYEAIRKRRRWSKDKILMEIKRLHQSGQSLSSRSIRENYPSLYSAACKNNFFGSWTLAMEGSKILPEKSSYSLSSPLTSIALDAA
ncbi:MAG: hypothetical protein SGI98_05800 [Verrucomicrobiota bacterium]|nr:hypothetical protein [Verrucomicrobiota bacterium]